MALMTLDEMREHLKKHKMEGDKCGKCGCTISTTVTGRQRVSDGWRCDNCYFDELGEFVEQNPIGGHLRR